MNKYVDIAQSYFKVLFLKWLLLLTCISVYSNSAYAQCNSTCETITRYDGASIVTCEPLPVAGDNTLEAAISIASNGVDKFLTLSVIFSNDSNSRKIAGNAQIRLTNNHMYHFTLVNSEMNFIGGRRIAQAVYYIDSFILSDLKEHKIATMSFRLNDQVRRTYQFDINQDVISKQLKCM